MHPRYSGKGDPNTPGMHFASMTPPCKSNMALNSNTTTYCMQKYKKWGVLKKKVVVFKIAKLPVAQTPDMTSNYL